MLAPLSAFYFQLFTFVILVFHFKLFKVSFKHIHLHSDAPSNAKRSGPNQFLNTVFMFDEVNRFIQVNALSGIVKQGDLMIAVDQPTQANTYQAYKHSSIIEFVK